MQAQPADNFGVRSIAPAITPAYSKPEMNRQQTDILVLATGGRNGETLYDVLEKAGLKSRLCSTMAALVSEVNYGAGAVLLMAQMLTVDGLWQLQEMLNQQAPWSDLPLVILVDKHQAGLIAGLDLRAQVTLL